MFSLAKPTQLNINWGLSPIKLFVLSTMVVNAGNYGYNLMLGNTLSPAEFSEAGFVVTLLLVFSFMAMTFQIAATKFSIELTSEERISFNHWLMGISLKVAVVLSAIFILFSGEISTFFQLSSRWIIILFALSLPIYFAMSIERGNIQGDQNFSKLSASYQLEMWSRFGITMLLIAYLPYTPGVNIAIAILCSVVVGYLATNGRFSFRLTKNSFPDRKRVLVFLAFTAGYELAQILINYSDMLLVKHYFEPSQAGYYTSIALIGRMIYFVTWMVVMVLIPKVIEQSRAGKSAKGLLMKYFGLIAVFSMVLIIGAYLFPELAVTILFGKEYLVVSHLLWMYGLATALFALANLFVYYFLSLDYYKPVWVAIFFGVMQVVLLTLFHESLEQIIKVQIANMMVLLVTQIVFFIRWRRA